MRGGGALSGVLHTWRLAVSLAFRTWPSGAAGRLAVAVVSQLSRGLLPGLALQRVVDAAGAGAGGATAGWMVVLALSSLTPGLDALWNFVQRGLMMRGYQVSVQMMMAATLAPAGIDHLESPRFADHMETVRTHRNAFPLLFDWLATMAGILLSLGMSLVVLAAVDLRLLLPVAGAAVMGLFQAESRRRSLAFMEQSLPGQRLAGRLAELGTSAPAAKEVRMLELGRWLVGRHQGLTDDVARRLVAGERGPALAAGASGVAQALMLAAGVAFLVRLVATGEASPGELALGIVLLQAALNQAGRLGGLGADMAKNTYSARRLLWLVDQVPDVVAPADPVPVPVRLHQGIVVDYVSFAYTGTERLVLDRVGFTLPAGATVALVGDNGAGKSTLVKLLCRFYDPTSGAISVDGVDLRELDLEAWRAATTGAFQDFVRLHVLARESVGAGELASIDDRARVQAAAAAGASAPFLELLADGYETQLGREFAGGADLSEGQWQKVALSRGLMRAAPLLVVLDEPTAALDARAEHALFERYAAEAASARRRGAVTLVVSHRFSTVRMADRIVVLESGRVAESGTHAELMARHGGYAELYSLQAEGFR